MSLPIGLIGPAVLPLPALLGACQHYEAAGYDAVLWTDHFMGMPNCLWTPDITPAAAFQRSPHTFYDTVATIAAVGPHTERIRLGTCVTDAIRRHPAMLAHEWLTLDHLTGGRAILGIGAGEAENLTPYGLDFSRPVTKLEEALEIVRLLWENNGHVDYDGQEFQLREGTCGLEPIEPGRYPQIWVAANGPRTLGITGRLADGWLPLYVSVDDYTRQRQCILDAMREAGRDRTPFTFSLVNYIVLCEKTNEAAKLLNHPLMKFLVLTRGEKFFEDRGVPYPWAGWCKGIVDFLPMAFSREDMLKATDQVPDELVQELIFFGTPDDIAVRLAPYRRAGLNHAVLMDVTALAAPEKATASAALFDGLVQELRSRE